MRILGASIERAMLAMFLPGENLTLGGAIALEFVGDNDARYGGESFQECAEELLRRPLVALALHQDVEHVALLIHGPSQIGIFVLAGEHHVVEAPCVAWPRTSAAPVVGVLLVNFAAPFADRLRGYDHAALTQELFSVPKAQAEWEVEPDGVGDTLHWKARVLVSSGR